jgi:nucleoside-diphosphate-sugar epimerase
MKILVTGAGGFIGREVLRCLALLRDAEVVAFDARLTGLTATRQLRLQAGDLADAAARAAAIGDGVDALIHLAAVPGGAAEADPALSQRVNIDATLDLFHAVAHTGKCPRVVFSSSIAVYGDPLPAAGVDDATPLAPRMLYGAHKAMAETMVATLSRRGAIDGMSLRLPGIVARPQGPSGMKSAFMSLLFHQLRAGQPFVSPVSPQGAMWLMSVSQCADNLVRAVISTDTDQLPADRALTLPAQRITMQALVDAVARQTGVAASMVTYAPDAALQAGFAAQPPLTTQAADAAGFVHDGDIDTLVARALDVIARAAEE